MRTGWINRKKTWWESELKSISQYNFKRITQSKFVMTKGYWCKKRTCLLWIVFINYQLSYLQVLKVKVQRTFLCWLYLIIYFAKGKLIVKRNIWIYLIKAKWSPSRAHKMSRSISSSMIMYHSLTSNYFISKKLLQNSFCNFHNEKVMINCYYGKFILKSQMEL